MHIPKVKHVKRTYQCIFSTHFMPLDNFHLQPHSAKLFNIKSPRLSPAPQVISLGQQQETSLLVKARRSGSRQES